MKKTFIIILMLIISFSLIGQNQKQTVKQMYEKAYIYKTKSLLISRSEFNCSFFITDKIAEDVVIIGAKQKWLGKTFYTDENEMYINKGSKDGIKDGDVFSVIENGGKVGHPFKTGSLGTYYGKKSLAIVTCTYEDKAIVKLKEGCHPVYIGDFLIKHKQEKPIFEEQINYKNCKLIKSDINGRVVYHKKSDKMATRTMFGDDYMIAVDVGNAFLKKGDFLLFYKEFNKNLPPLITGTGIVVSAQKTNSTVKLLKLSNPVHIGDKFTHLPIFRKNVFEGKEKLPEIGSKQKEIEIKEDDKVLELVILFDLSDNSISDTKPIETAKIADFIKDKTQYTIVLKGFTCNIGRVEYNLKLAKERVEAVKKYIVEKLKIDPTLIESYFYGENNCEFDNTTEESRKKNRRVTITIIGK